MPLGGASLRPKIKLMPPVTLFLIAANAGIFLLQLSAPGLETAFALWPLGAARALPPTPAVAHDDFSASAPACRGRSEA